MDDQFNQELTNNEENTSLEYSEVEDNAPKSLEQPAQQSFHNNQSQWQGGYSYSEPQYRDFYVNQEKKKNTGLLVAAVTAAVIMVICCLVITLAQVLNLTGVIMQEQPEVDAPDTQTDVKQEEIESAGRDDEAVYNMPEIYKEEKKGEALSIVQINKKVKNSVVAVLISKDSNQEPDFSGSGFLISRDGYIITNAHVIDGAAKVEVVLIDGITSYDAAVVGQDERSDLAILKVDATGLAAAELGDSDQLEEGEEVVCIGNPYGMELSGSITNGIVSALNRKIEMNGGYMTLIQTNAEINPGNSGGPLINSYGQVVGITSSKLVATGYEGIGFAIPINEAIKLSEELINYGYIKSRAYIGFSGNDLTDAYAEYHGLPKGVYVVFVNAESDAAKKGLQEDDIVVGFNGEEISSMAELNALKDSFHPGDEVTITVWRKNKTFDLNIILAEGGQ